MEETRRLQAATRQVNQVAWSLLGYILIMNVVATAVLLLDAVLHILPQLQSTGTIDWVDFDIYLTESVTSNGWGYLLSILLGACILLLWKKPRYFRNVIFRRNRKMTVASFFQLLAVFLCAQAILQFFYPVMEMCLNLLGYSSMAAMEIASMESTGFSMFLYAALLGPVAEELLMRGLVLRLLEPYGKRFAIVLSAILFGLFHGNVVQIPFAFLVGLVLGYVAVEYSIWWAILLHIINNFALSELMVMLYQYLPMFVVDILFVGILAVALLASVVILILRRKEIKAYFQENKISFFSVEAAARSVPLWIFAMGMLLMCFMTVTYI